MEKGHSRFSKRTLSLRKKCPYSKLFWSAFSPLFSRIQTKYGAILRMSPYSVRMQENGEKMRTRIIPNTETFSAVCETL